MFLASLAVAFTLTSCVSTAYAQTDEVYTTTSDENVNVQMVITYGVPVLDEANLKFDKRCTFIMEMLFPFTLRVILYVFSFWGSKNQNAKLGAGSKTPPPQKMSISNKKLFGV